MLNKKGFGIPVALMTFGAGIFCLALFVNKFSVALVFSMLGIGLIGVGIFYAIKRYEQQYPDDI